jgi:hypothetical protein
MKKIIYENLAVFVSPLLTEVWWKNVMANYHVWISFAQYVRDIK